MKKSILFCGDEYKDFEQLVDTGLDVTNPETVEIVIRPDKKVVWINVNGVCLLRCCQIQKLDVNDGRTIIKI